MWVQRKLSASANVCLNVMEHILIREKRSLINRFSCFSFKATNIHIFFIFIFQFLIFTIVLCVLHLSILNVYPYPNFCDGFSHDCFALWWCSRLAAGKWVHFFVFIFLWILLTWEKRVEASWKTALMSKHFTYLVFSCTHLCEHWGIDFHVLYARNMDTFCLLFWSALGSHAL